MDTLSTKSIKLNSKSYLGVSILLSILLAAIFFCITTFVPDFWFHANWFGNNGQSFFTSFNDKFIINGEIWQKALAWVYWILNIFILVFTTILIWPVMRQIFAVINQKQIFTDYLNESQKIINSCKNLEFCDKVAMVVSTCNDVVPSTIWQTAQQTYKNIDVWICDDSNKPEIIKKIDDFAAKMGYFVCHRDVEHKKAHPTKLGNLFYFIEKHGSKYDYVFENDSSSIITENFVYNALCYFHSPLLDHTKDGGVISNGGFYGTKLLLPYIYSQAWRMSERISLVGSSIDLGGNPGPLNGWGAMYKIETLKQIPISDVECPSCDLARGLWLNARGYRSYLNPFDFAAKMCTQNMEAVKNQFLKWHGAEVFLFRNGVFRAKFPDRKTNFFLHASTISMVIILPFSVISTLFFVATMAALNFFYLNLSVIILMIILALLIFTPIAILLVVKDAPIKSFVFFGLFFPLTYFAIMYRKVWQNVVRGFILKKWSSGAVTVKGVCRLTIKQKLRMCLLDFIVIALTLTLCIVLTCTLTNDQLSRFIIWFSIFLVITGPSWVYIGLTWVGSITVKVGWDENMIVYNHWVQDFRYPLVKETEVWKQQHKK